MPVQVRLRAGWGRAGRLVATVLLPLALAAAARAARPVDFKQALQVTDVSGGWFDAGIVDGKNKLVPSVTFRISKPADVRLRSLSLNVHFKKIVDPSKPGWTAKRSSTKCSCRRSSSRRHSRRRS